MPTLSLMLHRSDYDQTELYFKYPEEGIIWQRDFTEKRQSGKQIPTMMEKSGLNEFFHRKKYEINDAIGGISSDIYSIASNFIL